jgi:serine/threonine protein kinase/tetratricopeptide (TPR) repeat protein
MTPPAPRARDIFLDAIEISSPEQRAAFLDAACSGDAELRRRVDALIAAHERPESLLDRAAVAVAVEAPPPFAHGGTDPSRPQEGPGTVIGPYTLLERIGEGGMGVVYMAEQTEPLRRRVALKVIKPGMDSEQVLARFDAEREALALMDHPSIAKVLDAGTTPLGRPYFVMELVDGVPITRYSDEARLTPRQRLELFIPVCQAVQHAHQKGIIHRDIKPSNILVTLIDGRPVPKVIDFGVAKAIDQRLTERTLFTRFGAIVGTPEYMSPEQAAASGQDIDTRSDVYSLGVLLYELLTGSTPLDRATLREEALNELLRRVREEEPPRPSTRLSGTNERLPSVAAQRGTEPARLAKLVRGDLDWLVMKALEKDRGRRYETPSGFARDIQRYLDGDPVEAGPPSRGYRLRKFARKHRAALAVAAGFALILVAATAISAWQAVRATRAEELARRRLGEVERAQAATSTALAATKQAQAATAAALEQSEEARAQSEAVSKFLTEAFRSPDPEQDGRQIKVADVLDRAVEKLDKEFAGSPKTKGALLEALGQTYGGLGMYDRAEAVLEKARGVLEATLGFDNPDTLTSRNDLAVAYADAGRYTEAIALHQATLKLREAKLGPDHPDTLASRHNLADAYLRAGRYTEAINMDEQTLKLQHETLGADHPHTLGTCNDLANAYLAGGRYTEAINMHKETLKLCTAKLGPDHPNTLHIRNNLAECYCTAGRYTEAIEMHEETLKLREAKLGPDHPLALQSRNNLAGAYWQVGRLDRSIPLFEETLRQKTSKPGPDHPETLITEANLGVNYRDANRVEEGAHLMEDALRRAGGRPDVLAALVWVRSELAAAYQALGRWDRAGPLLGDLLSRQRKTVPPDSPALAASLATLGMCLLRQEKWSEAESVLRECLAIRAAKLPDDWSRFNSMSQLGGSLLGQGRYAEAEPLIVQGYEGLKAREAQIPAPGKTRLPEAAEQVVRLYEAWGKPEQAAVWKAKLGLRDLPTDVFSPR